MANNLKMVLLEKDLELHCNIKFGNWSSEGRAKCKRLKFELMRY